MINPKILTHPNIPKPLHGLNPRALKGQEWWDIARQEAYASTNYHCIACGVHKKHAHGPKWLEAHEYWDIDYMTGTCTVIDIVPLCHYCHNFIHSGRLYMICGKEKPKSECIDILQHGFLILKENNLQAFSGTLEVANLLGANTFGVECGHLKVNPNIKWKDWNLVLEGEAYFSKFEDYEEWKSYYQRH